MTVSRQTLLDQIQQEYPTSTARCRFGDLEVDFTRVANPDDILDDATLLGSHEELAWQPYWAEAWDTAHGMAVHLAALELAGRDVLDLGCGLGLTGAVAAARGAHVLLADYAPPALLFAELNTWPWREQTRVARVNWRADHLDEKFDLIIGSDILYDRDDLPYLDRFWREHLKAGGKVLLGEPSRAMSREFFDWLRNQPWQMEVTTMQIPDTQRPVRIVELTGM